MRDFDFITTKPKSIGGHFMANSNSDNLVALFVDYENLVLSYHQQLNGSHQQVEKFEELEWKTILDFVRGKTGRIVIKRAYANWAFYSIGKQRELLGHGFELVNTPSRGGKNAADIKIVIDAINTLRQQDEKINNFFIVSGDGDFIDLVHHLHAHGKIVRGMGVSGTTSDYLIKVCDEFAYYDIMVKPPQKEDDSAAEAETKPMSFDLSEARQILREALEKFEDGWMEVGNLKNTMLKINPAFNERNYGFDRFKAFLDAQDDMVETRPIKPLGLEIRKVVPNGAAPDKATPEKLLDRYLAELTRVRVRMSPTEHRKTLIINLYKIIEESREVSLTGALEILATMIEKNAPYISYSVITDAAYQLFHCKCFEFSPKSNYPEGTKLWDRTVSFGNGISSANELLTMCDRELLAKINKNLNADEKIDPEVATRLLYGKEGVPYKKDYVEKLITEIDTSNFIA
jgi:uncharacterized LabA/DUF88 family protein